MKAPPALCVFVCGSVDRGDDGAAMLAVGRLLAGIDRRRLRRIAIERCGQLDVQQLLDVPSGTPVLIVDAAAGIRAGRIVRRSLDELIDHRRGPAPRSSHALPVNQILGIVNVLAARPLRGYFVGIGGEEFRPGRPLSPAVSRELPAFVDAIAETIDELAPAAAVGAAAGRGRCLSGPMCISLPAQVLASSGPTATVALDGRRLSAQALLFPDLDVGQWVAVVAGTVVSRLTPAEAALLIEDVRRARGDKS